MFVALQGQRGACLVRRLVKDRHRATHAGLQQQGDNHEYDYRFGSLLHGEQRRENFRVAGVPDEVLNPRASWSDKSAYDQAAKRLQAMFEKNYEAVQSGRELGAMDG